MVECTSGELMIALSPCRLLLLFGRCDPRLYDNTLLQYWVLVSNSVVVNSKLCRELTLLIYAATIGFRGLKAASAASISSSSLSSSPPYWALVMSLLSQSHLSSLTQCFVPYAWFFWRISVVDANTTVQDVGLVLVLVLFTSVKLALDSEAVLAANVALDFLDACGRGSTWRCCIHALMSFIMFSLVVGVSNLRLWKNNEVALMVRELNMMDLHLITTHVFLEK